MTWYELVFPWQPLAWYLDVLRASPCTDCLDIYQDECQQRRFAFNDELRDIYDAECNFTCGEGGECSAIKMYIGSGGSSNVSSFYDDQIPFAGVQSCTLFGQEQYRPFDCLDQGAQVSIIFTLLILFFISTFCVVSNIAILRIYSRIEFLHMKTNTEERFSILADLFFSISYKVGVICANHPGKSGKFR